MMRTIFPSSASTVNKTARNVRKGDKPVSQSNQSSKRSKKPDDLDLVSKKMHFKERWEDERVRSTVGLIGLVISAFLILSTLSAIFSGSYDTLLVTSDTYKIPATNLGGKLGALVGHYLVRGTFGFGFLAAPAILFLLGFKALTGRALLPIAKFTRWALLAMVALPWAVTFFCHDKVAQSHDITLNVSDHLVGQGSVFLLKFTLIYLSTSGSAILLLGLILFTLYQFAPGWPEKIKFDKLKTVFGQMSNWVKNKNSESVLDEDPSPESTHIDSIESPVGNTTSTNVLKEKTELENIVDTIVNDTDGEEKETPNKDTNFKIKKTTQEPGIELEIKVKEDEEQLSQKEVNKMVQEFGEYDPTLDLASFKMPGLEHLENHGDGKNKVTEDELSINKDKIIETLLNFKIEVAEISAEVGPTVTLYEIVPAPGIRISKIKNLEDDIALSLSALGIRIIAPIPGRGTIGIEVPNSKPDVVSMLTLIRSEKFQNSDCDLPIALGKTISNETHIFDLAKMPHLLMAGATGQGKSVGLNAMLVSLLYRKHPSALKFVLVDPKKVELSVYDKISRHYLAQLPGAEEAIITDTDKVVATLNSLCKEMDQRYDLLKDAQCRNLKEYNQKFINRKIVPETGKDLHPERGHHFLPYIVLVVDEFADLIMTAGKEVETPIARLAQLARAIGIHLIIATQRPSVNIITGTIKANFPARVAFRVTSKIDSRTILDAGGADQLIGRGDMLMSTGNDLIRLQCGFVDTPEVESICNYITGQRGYPETFELPEFSLDQKADRGASTVEERDELFEEAASIIVMHQQGSTSLLQRKLKLGYNRAGRIVDQLEDARIIGPFEGSKARKVLIPDEVSLEQLLRKPFEGEE
jgi:DNA segregation ATPase FtsK/SpoIIIE, S-DNA-T family